MKTELTSPQGKWWVLISIGIGTFMSALDGSVVNISLPAIRQYFGSDIASVEWVITVYLLILSGLLLSFGRLGDLRGHKRIYVTGFFLFITSSALCGLARSLPTLVAFRAMQALGAAMISSNSPAILTSSFPSSQRGQALGIQATMTYLGLTVGPSFGGWLTTQFNWHAVFYINVPVGLLALWSALRFIPMDTPSEVTERFDLQGAGIFLFGLVALLLGLNQGHEFGWASPAILLLSAIAAILLPVFVFMENRAQFPMLDLRLFRNRSFTGAVASAILNYICVSGVLFLMPFYLIQGRMLSTAQAGLIMTSQPIVMAVIAPLSGTLSDRIGPRLPAATGMLVMTGGIFLLSTVTSISPLILIIGYLVLIGLGTGTFISPNNSSLMGSAARNRQGIAAGILATARTFGMVLGVGLTGAIFNTSMIHEAAGSENPGLFSAMHMSYLVLAVIALTGALLATFRETRQQID